MKAPRNPHIRQLTIPLELQDNEFADSSPVRTVTPWVNDKTPPGMDFESEIASSASAPERMPEVSGVKALTVVESRPSAEPVPFRQPMTARQQGFLFALARELGLSEHDLANDVSARFGVASIGDLNRRQAAALIGKLQDALAMPVAS